MRKLLYIISGIGWLWLVVSATAQSLEPIPSDLIDLGEVQEGAVIRDTLRLVNRESKPVKIKSIRTGCQCTAAELDKNDISPKDTAEVAYTFNTKGYHGVVRKTMTLVLEDRNAEPIQVTLQVKVITELDVNPRFIYLQKIPLDKKAKIIRKISVKNQSKQTISILRIQIDDDMVSIRPSSAIIAPGKETPFEVEIRPLRKGHFYIQMIVETDFPKKPKVMVPVYLDILGD